MTVYVQRFRLLYIPVLWAAKCNFSLKQTRCGYVGALLGFQIMSCRRCEFPILVSSTVLFGFNICQSYSSLRLFILANLKQSENSEIVNGFANKLFDVSVFGVLALRRFMWQLINYDIINTLTSLVI